MFNHGPGNRPGHPRVAASRSRGDESPHVTDSHVTGTHTTGTEERGSFALARCSCGWTGPARRARIRAREDAAAHARD